MVNPFKFASHYDDEVIVNPFRVNRYLLIIYNFFLSYGSFKRWKTLYDYVRARVRDWRVCLITGRELSREQFEGRIRSIVEEHSGDSRQLQERRIAAPWVAQKSLPQPGSAQTQHRVRLAPLQ